MTGVPAPVGPAWLIGDVHEMLAGLPDGSVHAVITSPPYWRKRRYLPADHPDASLEMGQEPSPGEYLASLLRVTDALWRVLRDDGTIWVNLGDTAAGSGGAGGDYNEGGLREGQPKYGGSNTSGGGLAANGKRRSESRPTGIGTPRPKSVCWLPQLFGASLAYGRNLLTGEPCRQWITRPPVTWCKPAPTPGEIFDKFREATELIVWAAKQPSYYFDLDAVREEPTWDDGRDRRNDTGHRQAPGQPVRNSSRQPNPKGVPPKTWWVVHTSGYEGAHFATFPAELIRRPVIAACPPGGTILDPFGGAGTTAMVATGRGRNCISIDLDPRNADLARERLGMFAPVDAEPEPVDDPQLPLFDALQEAGHG